MFSLAASCACCSRLRRYKYDAAKIIFTARHEILATGCIQALAKASTLFGEVAHRVAFFFVREGRLLDAAAEFFFFVEADEPVFELECVVRACFEVVCVAAVVVWDPAFFRAERPCTRACGASFTGSATVRVAPDLTAFDFRRFHRRNCSTVTPKRSATVTSVSPRWTV